MENRPVLTNNLDSKVFRNYYYLKEELVNFCRQNSLQTTGSKLELTGRIIHYLDTGEKLVTSRRTKTNNINQNITLDSIIEGNFICTEKHRTFFKKQIGKSFSFNVMFQKWLKSNSGKTYQEAINAYLQIIENKKKSITTIDKQFEYNTYIRDFFNENKDKSLEEAIKYWKYKKSISGHNRYENSDLNVLVK